MKLYQTQSYILCVIVKRIIVWEMIKIKNKSKWIIKYTEKKCWMEFNEFGRATCICMHHGTYLATPVRKGAKQNCEYKRMNQTCRGIAGQQFQIWNDEKLQSREGTREPDREQGNQRGNDAERDGGWWGRGTHTRRWTLCVYNATKGVVFVQSLGTSASNNYRSTGRVRGGGDGPWPNHADPRCERWVRWTPRRVRGQMMMLLLAAGTAALALALTMVLVKAVASPSVAF